jgi:hypothetical protein
MKRRNKQSYMFFCFSFWFDIFRTLSIFLFFLPLTYTLISITPEINIDEIYNEKVFLGVLLYFLFFAFNFLLLYFLIKIVISWIVFGWIEKENAKGSCGYKFIFHRKTLKNWVVEVDIELDAIRDVTRTAVFWPEDKAIYKSQAKKIENGGVMIQVPKHKIKEAIHRNQKLWLKVRWMKYFEINRCFKP